MKKQGEISAYHAHIYFDETTRETAEVLHLRLDEKFGQSINLYTLSNGPRGPHITRMFGVDIPIEIFESVLNFLILNRGPHAVLIHPVTGNELLDHTHNALWLGERQSLNLSVLVD